MNKIGKGLQLVKDACFKKGYDFKTEGGDGINTASRLYINHFEIKLQSNAYDNADLEDMADVILNYSMKELRFVYSDKSITYANNGCYVKDSYRNSKQTLFELLDTAVKGAMISKSKVESIEDRYIAKDFSVDSAFMYGEYYVTPYIIISTLNNILQNEVQHDLLCKFINHYMNKKVEKLNKTDIEECSKYLFTQYFKENNKLLLSEIDGMKVLQGN